MAAESWLCLGGTEITSSCRTAAYTINGFRPLNVSVRPCACCGTPAQWASAMSDPVYTNPTADAAPWYSASEPDSGDFAGLMVTSVEGLGAGPITRELTQRVNGRGSFVGPKIQSAPVVIVEGFLLGKTCCSVDYGKRWLGTVLQGSCDSDCDGDTLAFLDCCPDFDGCATADPVVTPFDCLTPHLRYLEGVKLIQSVEVVEKYGSCCGDCNGTAYMKVRFQLGADAPCVYREPVEIVTDQAFDVADELNCDITWILVADGETCPDDTICAEDPDCLADPDCANVPAPPTAPLPSNPCICSSFNTRRACVDIPAGSIPEYTEGLPVATIKSGSNELRQIRLRFWVNNSGLPVEDLDACDACGEVTLSKIPADSEFVFDAKTRKATITCPGSAPTDATPLMGSAGGTLPVAWPEIACAGSRFTMCVEADSDSVAADATISLSIAPAECYS